MKRAAFKSFDQFLIQLFVGEVIYTDAALNIVIGVSNYDISLGTIADVSLHHDETRKI